MANLGAITELVASNELTLELGSDIYLGLKNLQIHIGRSEEQIGTTDTESLWLYGKADSFFTATLFLTTPELDGATTEFNALTQLSSDGDLTTTSWKIVARDEAGTSKTMACTGMLKDYDIRKEQDLVEIDIFVRIIGDTVTIS